MTKHSNIKFTQLYNEVRKLFPNVMTLTDEELMVLDIQNEKNKSILETNSTIFTNIIISAFVILCPICSMKLYSSLSAVTVFMKNTKATLATDLIEVLTATFMIGGIALPCYFLIFPFLQSKSSSQISLLNLNMRQANYVFATIIATYVAIGFGALALFLNFDNLSEFIADNFIYYLFIPLLLISLSLVGLILVFTLLPLDKYYDRKSKHKINVRVKICNVLLKTLKEISSYENFYFLNPKDSKEILANLSQIGYSISNYSDQYIEYIESTEVHDDFKKAGAEFEKNLLSYISTKDSHSEAIKDSLVNYLNIFLKGDLSKLPKAENIPDEEKQRKAKLIHYFLLALYISFPIIVVLILKVFFNITFDEFTQSIFRILYLIWAFIGVFSNPFILNSESKELLKDILKTITGKN